MTKTFAIALVGATCALAAPALADENQWVWAGGDAITIALPGTVHYRPGAVPRVIVHAAPAVLDRIHLRGGRLTLSDGAPVQNGDIDVTLSGMTLDRVALESSAALDLGILAQNTLTLSISGSGSVRGSGHVDNLTLTLSGAGSSHMQKLIARKARISISGSGDADVTAEDEAAIGISGSGSVHLAGAPRTISTSIAGSGQVFGAAGTRIASRATGRSPE